MINIVSKDQYKITLENKIISLAKGLEPYPQNEDIVFEQIVTSQFLRAFKLFYETNQYDPEKMKIPKPINSKDTEKYFGKTIAEFIQPFIDQAIKEKKISIFIQFIQGAYLFQAVHFIEFINCCLALVFYCKGNSDYDVKQFQKDWNLKDNQESSFQQPFVQKLQQKYISLLQVKEVEQPIQQVENVVGADEEEEW